ncbi:MAG: hypothetical protein IT385_04100 [Deltaproteobacteria bacterium]|nr:hypothetical protein [Deltaproteobacteria bacterium]
MTRFTTSLIAVLATALVACGDTVYEIPVVPPGASGKTDKAVFDDDGRLIDPRGDSDGDGIPDKEELDGWTITVDPDGFAVLALGTQSYQELLEVRAVTSDPRYADTDGDGLSDGDERRAKCDPRRIDTDGDTLGDADELGRWGTSPSSVDTDGDARGGDPDKPRPPLFELFDAGELRLVKNPVDPDGPRIPGPGATAPYLPDTDGDGNGDYGEVLGGTVRPNVAEIGILAIEPTPGAELDLYLNVKLSETETDTSTWGSSTVVEESGYIANRTATGLSFETSQYAAAYVDETVRAGCCGTVVEASIEVGVKEEQTARTEMSLSIENRIGFAAETNHIMNEARTRDQNEEIEISGGTIRIPVDVVNTGPIPFRLEGLVLGVSRYDRYAGKYVPVVEIAGDDMSLGVGERRTVFLSTSEVPTDAMYALMADPRSLVITGRRFSLLDQYGVDMDFQMAEVLANTAVITIDYGTHADRHFVAANADLSGGITIGQALRDAWVDFEAIPVDRDEAGGDEAYLIEINGRGTELHAGPAPDLDERLPYPEGKTPGPRLIKRGWFAAVQRFDEDYEDTTYYANLFDAPVFPGDRVTILYTEDLDRDGVPAVEEERLGSSDLLKHSDGTAAHPEGDGLSDFWEARVGWTVEWAGRAPYLVLPSPADIDSDRDGLRDDEEAGGTGTDFGTGSDPWMADTDEDGLSDKFERDDTLYGLDPTAPVGQLPTPEITCEVTVGYEGDAWLGDPLCKVVAQSRDVSDDDLPSAVVDCSAFTLVGGEYRATVDLGPVSREITVPRFAFEGTADTILVPDDDINTPEKDGYFEPVPRSKVCNALVRYPGSFWDDVWVRVPCSAFRDVQYNDGGCDTIRPCLMGDDCWVDRLEAAGWDFPPDSMPDWDEPEAAPRCADLDPPGEEPDPFYVVTAAATDAESDLRGIVMDFKAAQGAAVFQTPIAEVADCGECPLQYESADSLAGTYRFEDCFDPATIDAEAYDAMNLRKRVTCAWAPDNACVVP